jgi:hypothetical protein
MGFTKFADAEDSEILSPKEHAQIETDLHKIGKTNARILSSQQRERVLPHDPMKSSFRGIMPRRTAEGLKARS